MLVAISTLEHSARFAEDHGGIFSKFVPESSDQFL